MKKRYEVNGFIDRNCDKCKQIKSCVNIYDNKLKKGFNLCRSCTKKKRIEVDIVGRNFK